jgi:hypothetical protein
MLMLSSHSYILEKGLESSTASDSDEQSRDGAGKAGALDTVTEMRP